MAEFKFYNELDPGTKGTEIWLEKDGFKPSSRLVWKIIETGDSKLNCDPLADMHHTQN